MQLNKQECGLLTHYWPVWSHNCSNCIADFVTDTDAFVWCCLLPCMSNKQTLFQVFSGSFCWINWTNRHRKRKCVGLCQIWALLISDLTFNNMHIVLVLWCRQHWIQWHKTLQRVGSRPSDDSSFFVNFLLPGMNAILLECKTKIWAFSSDHVIGLNKWQHDTWIPVVAHF